MLKKRWAYSEATRLSREEEALVHARTFPQLNALCELNLSGCVKHRALVNSMSQQVMLHEKCDCARLNALHARPRHCV